MRGWHVAVLCVLLVAILAGTALSQEATCLMAEDVSTEELYLENNPLSAKGANKIGKVSHNEGSTLVIANESNGLTVTNTSVAHQFVRETDFETASVVVVQTAASERRRLKLKCVRPTPDGFVVHVGFSAESEPQPHVLRTHTLLIRVTDRSSESIEKVSVSLEKYNLPHLFW